MNVIVFASRKGGSGKSTLAAHLAAQVKSSKQVMLVDADPQGSLTLWHKLRGTNEPPIKAAVNSVSGIVSAANHPTTTTATPTSRSLTGKASPRSTPKARLDAAAADDMQNRPL